MICQQIIVSGDQLRFLSTKSHSIRSMKVIKYTNKDSFKPFNWGGGGRDDICDRQIQEITFQHYKKIQNA